MAFADVLALDKASIREVDKDGHLHVDGTPISKAIVNGYYGAEIPDGERMGLDPKKIYQLLRHPDELKKGADTFNGKPLQIIHKGQSADSHDKVVVVGAVSNARFDAPYLRADLSVWDGAAIAGIDSDQQRQLSCGYRYVADMTPGEYDGVKYDGVMRDIEGNHVALVEKGRAGPDVLVGDAAIEEPNMSKQLRASPKRMALVNTTLAALKPKLAADAALPDISAVLLKFARDSAEMDDPEDTNAEDERMEGEEDDAWKKRKAMNADKRAKDCEKKAEDARRAADRARDEAETPEEKKAREEMEARDRARDADPTPQPDMVKKPAMDAAIRMAEDSAVARVNAIWEAKAAVRPIVGEITAPMASADAVYKFALDHQRIDTEGVHPSAYPAILKAHTAAAAKPRIANDAAPPDSLTKIPGFNRLRKGA